jgi:hypothetical protein
LRFRISRQGREVGLPKVHIEKLTVPVDVGGDVDQNPIFVSILGGSNLLSEEPRAGEGVYESDAAHCTIRHWLNEHVRKPTLDLWSIIDSGEQRLNDLPLVATQGSNQLLKRRL